MKSHPALTKALRAAPKLPTGARLVNIKILAHSIDLEWLVTKGRGSRKLLLSHPKPTNNTLNLSTVVVR